MFDTFGYFHTVYELCNEDYTSMDYWTDKTFVYFLNCRYHWKEWQEEKMRLAKEK